MRISVLFACILALQGAYSVPSTLQPSCERELATVERGGSLQLRCGSHCSEVDPQYTWWRLGEQPGLKRQIGFTGATVTEERVSVENGGEYECRCGRDGQVCTFYVAVLPEVTFIASHTATHYGDVVTLTCSVEGNPANYTSITNAYGVPLQTQSKKISTFRMETTAVLRDIDEEDYVCEVETHHRGNHIAQMKQSLKINLYSPPSIMYTTEYVLREEGEFGSPGHLSCVVHTPPDSQSHVTWWAGGEELVKGEKYRMTSSEMSNEVTVFRLEMDRVEHTDIGPYLCQLSSQYHIEETQDAWIKVDYRKESRGVGGGASVDRGGQATVLSGSSVGSLRGVGVLVCLVMVVGLGTWGVVLRRRSVKRRGWSDGIIGSGQQGLMSSSPLISLQSSGQSSVSVFKRK